MDSSRGRASIATCIHSCLMYMYVHVYVTKHAHACSQNKATYHGKNVATIVVCVLSYEVHPTRSIDTDRRTLIFTEPPAKLLHRLLAQPLALQSLRGPVCGGHDVQVPLSTAARLTPPPYCPTNNIVAEWSATDGTEQLYAVCDMVIR